MKKSVIKYLFPLASLCLFLYGVQYYNDGDNYINHNVVERITDINNEKYALSGHVRTSETIDRVFDESLSSGNFLFGEKRKFEANGAGYKVFIIDYGIVAAIIYFLFYYKLSTFTKNRKYGIGFFILVLMTFVQSAYPSSYSWSIPFILGIMSEKYLTLLTKNTI